MSDEYVTTDVAAKLLPAELSTESVRRWARQGLVRSKKQFRLVLVHRADVLAMVRDGPRADGKALVMEGAR